MQVIRLPRRGGKTTKCLEILRDNEKSIMFCHTGLNIDHEILQTNPELKKRIFTTSDYELRVRGMNLDTIIIDNADLIPTSVLLGMINFFVKVPLMGEFCNLVITTTA